MSTISIIYVVRNGGKYIRLFLDSLKKQTYKDFCLHVWDNNSTDDTREIIKKEYPEFKLFESPENIGVWAAFEKLLRSSTPKYVVCMTDVILKEDFLEKAVEVMEKNPDCGAVQGKIYQMKLYGAERAGKLKTNIIDTCGFQIFKSRKVINLGHGEEDKGQFNEKKEVFAVEGVVPIFRRAALESCRINGHIVDPDYRVGSFGYGDDLDFAWRMRLFGWKQILVPNVIAYHDRSTTKGYSNSARDYLSRVKERQKIDIIKRQLDWRNVRFTLIKNDYIINILKDLPYILAREIGVLGYTILFEPRIFAELPNFMKLLPKMISNRRKIMSRAKIGPSQMRIWFQ